MPDPPQVSHFENLEISSVRWIKDGIFLEVSKSSNTYFGACPPQPSQVWTTKPLMQVQPSNSAENILGAIVRRYILALRSLICVITKEDCLEQVGWSRRQSLRSLGVVRNFLKWILTLVRCFGENCCCLLPVEEPYCDGISMSSYTSPPSHKPSNMSQLH